MSSNRTVIEAAVALVVVKGELDAIDQFFTPDYAVHLTDGELAGGHSLIRRAVGMLLKAFSDLQIDVDILVADGDRIAWRRTLRGTQAGPYKGFPATGRTVVWRDMITSEFRDGKISQEWVVTDLAERLLLGRKG